MRRSLALLIALCVPSAVPSVALAQARTVRLSAAGDLVLNPHAMNALRDAGADAYTELLSGYAASVRPDEIAFVNVEQPLVNDVNDLDPGWPRQDTSRPRRSPILGATPALADALGAAGVDVAQVSNNHSYDQGHAGLRRTMEALARVGIASAGAGEGADAAYAHTLVERDGVRVAFLAFSEFFNRHPRDAGATVAARLDSDERVAAALAAARAEADVVVVAVHWSRDFVTRARGSERRRARALIAAGADVILGTGPHVLHSVERLESPRGEAVVAYSLGNVVSGMGRTYRIGHPPRGFIHPANVTPEARDGVVLRLALRLEAGRVTVGALEAVPLWTENNWIAHQREGAPHRIRAVRLDDAPADVQAERRPVVQRALSSAVTLVDGN